MTSSTMVNIPKLEFWIAVLFLQLCKLIHNSYLFSKPQYRVHWDVKWLANKAKEKGKKNISNYGNASLQDWEETLILLRRQVSPHQQIWSKSWYWSIWLRWEVVFQGILLVIVLSLHLLQLCMRSDPVGPQKVQSREHSTLTTTKPPKNPSEKLKHDWAVEQMGKISFPLEWKVPVLLRLNSSALVLNFMFYFPLSR